MSPSRLATLSAGIVPLLLPAPGARAGEPEGAVARVELPAPGAPPWRHVPLRNVERTTRYAAGVEDGTALLWAESACAASLQALALSEVDLDATPWLSWRWRVERSPGPRDERSRDGDDFAARVYAAFRLDPSRESAWRRLWHRVAESFYGDELPGSSLVWVWSSDLPRGTRWESPYAESTHMEALVSGRSGGWRTEWVDVRAAYRAAFGGNPPPLRGVALMTDSDDTCSGARAAYAGFRFAARPPPGHAAAAGAAPAAAPRLPGGP